MSSHLLGPEDKVWQCIPDRRGSRYSPFQASPLTAVVAGNPDLAKVTPISASALHTVLPHMCSYPLCLRTSPSG